MKLKAYQYPKCGTCRNAMKWLEAKGHEVEKIDLFEQPPSKEELRMFLEKSGLGIKKLFNTSGELYKELNMKDKVGTLSEDELLDLLAQHGRLVKRPIVTDGERVTVGFKEDAYAEAWS